METESIQGSQLADHNNNSVSTISLRVEFKSDEKEVARGIVKTFKFNANNASGICQSNKCKYDIESGEFTINYYSSPAPPLDFNYRFVGKLKVETTIRTKRTVAQDNNNNININKTTKYLDIEIFLYRQSMTDDSVEVEGTAIVGPFSNPIAKYQVKGTLDYRLHMNDIDSSVLFLEGRRI
jgi:hypothetical protein